MKLILINMCPMRDMKFIPHAYIDVPFHHIASHPPHSFKIGWDSYVHPRDCHPLGKLFIYSTFIQGILLHSLDFPHSLVDNVPIGSVLVLKPCQCSHGLAFCCWASPTFPLPCSSFPNLPMFPMGRNYVPFFRLESSL